MICDERGLQSLKFRGSFRVFSHTFFFSYTEPYFQVYVHKALEATFKFHFWRYPPLESDGGDAINSCRRGAISGREAARGRLSVRGGVKQPPRGIPFPEARAGLSAWVGREGQVSSLAVVQCAHLTQPQEQASLRTPPPTPSLSQVGLRLPRDLKRVPWQWAAEGL